MHQVLDRTLLFRPLNHNQLLRSVVPKVITSTTSSEGTQRFCDGEPHLKVMKDRRRHLSKSGAMTNIGTSDALRRELSQPRA